MNVFRRSHREAIRKPRPDPGQAPSGAGAPRRRARLFHCGRRRRAQARPTPAPVARPSRSRFAAPVPLLLLLVVCPRPGGGVARADPLPPDDDNAIQASSGGGPGQPPLATPSPPPAESEDTPHANPRLKLCYRSFAVSNLDRTPLALAGLELDYYPLSTRWVRGGFTLAGGRGQGVISAQDVSMRYGLVGIAAGIQYPARITPFIEGQLSGGILSGATNGAIAVPGTGVAISGASAATWIYGRGIDVGAELYTIGRIYVSGSIGWLRTTWRGVDTVAMAQAPTAGVRFKDMTGDSLTFKLGLGF